MQAEPRTGQIRRQVYPHSAVFVLIANNLGRSRVGVEDEPIIHSDGSDAADELEHDVSFARQRAGLHVDVPGRLASVVGGEQHAAFEHQLFDMRGSASRARKPSSA